MLKESEVLVKVGNRNKNYFLNKGYSISNEKFIMIKVEDLSTGSHTKVTAICKFCKSENLILYGKYLTNKNRNDKGYYSCFSCKSVEGKKTCLEKYGVDHYSKTDEFKINESLRSAGQRKGGDA
jgi:hypothetical protein